MIRVCAAIIKMSKLQPGKSGFFDHAFKDIFFARTTNENTSLKERTIKCICL